MKTENLFKFVAIRVPNSQQSAGGRSFSIDNRDEEFVAMIARRTSSSVPLDRARREVATEFMNSIVYLPRNADWRAFLALEPELQRLVRQSTDTEELWDFVDQLFQARLGPEFALEEFVANNLFVRMKDALWRSYYSNIVLIDRRAQDRPSLVFWIRFFHLARELGRAGAGAGRSRTFQPAEASGAGSHGVHGNAGG
jgi:hypothetical protein